ncbi:hypothetical protein FRC09_015123 [Ceratobasidium sp. 395]|nr:hypothetical protein FRC09_015123 [Ceratobasidium sp. 395]
MPTQRQLDAALSSLLSSDMLKVGATSTGVLSAHGKLLVLDVREIVQSIARIGMEKNSDDLVQDVIWQYRSMSAVPVQVDANWHNQSKLDIDVDAAVNHLNEIPTVEQTELADDSLAFVGSLQTLLSLLLTSSAFRLLISDILITTREILADTASDVAAVAAYVETKAEDVEHTVRPDPHEGEAGISVEDAMNQAEKVDDTVRADLEKALKEAEMRKHVIEERLADESPDRIKQTIVERIEAIVQQAQGDPKYKSSLRTIVALCEKYAHLTAQATDSAVSAAQSAAEDSTAQASASVDPIIETDPHLKKLLGDIRTLLERFAGGHSLSPLGGSMKQFLSHLARDDSSGVSDLLRDAKIWLNKALETPGWLTTRSARVQLDALYDRSKNILNTNPPWRSDLRNASEEASAFSDNLKRDTATQQLLGAIDTLGIHTRALGLESVRSAGWKQIRAELWRDAVFDLDPSSHTAVAPESDIPPPSFFRVKSATVDVPGLDFTLARTHHWILNAITQPFLGPIVRAGMRYALSQSVRAGLEALDRKAGEVYAQAKVESEARTVDSEPTIWDWLSAFMKGQKTQANGRPVESGDEDVSSEEEDAAENGEPEVQTETQVTMKGVIRTTHQPAMETQPESETVLAVGVAEQILPGLGGPEDGGKVPEAVERAREAVGEVESAAGNVAEEAREVRENGEEAIADTKTKASKAAERMEERRKVERKRKGWKSKAFDI